MARAKGSENAPTDSVAPSGRVEGVPGAPLATVVDPWVVSVLRDGYRIPFRDLPPHLTKSLVPFPTYRPDSECALALLAEIDTMMAKGVLEIVSDPDPGFYSRLFLVEKSSGGWRPVLDLSPLNEFVHQTPFRMETPNSVLLAVRKNDFLASIDLKDAYFQIPVHPLLQEAPSFCLERYSLPVQSPMFQAVKPPRKCSQEFSQWSRLGLTLEGGNQPPPQTPPILGRVSVGVGSPPPRSISVGTMVRPGDLTPHQYPGDESSVPGTSDLPGYDHQPASDSNVRELHGSLRQQAGRDSFRLPLRVDRATSPLDGSPQQLEARYLLGQSNVLADLLSRRNQVLVVEWSLLPQVAKKIIRTWGSPTIDLFATHLNAKLSLYCSLIPDPQAVFEDAFRHPWNNLDVYAFPPFNLVERVVARVRETPNLSMTLIAPLWPEKSWFADLLLLLTQPPLTLPPWDRLLLQSTSIGSTAASTL